MVTDKQMANLRPQPFKPGQSGNPKGRTPGIPNTATRLQRLLTLVEKQKNPVTGEIEDFTVAEILDMRQVMNARKGDIKAYKELMDRLEGQSTKAVDITTKGEAINTPNDPALAAEFQAFLKGRTKE